MLLISTGSENNPNCLNSMFVLPLNYPKCGNYNTILYKSLYLTIRTLFGVFFKENLGHRSLYVNVYAPGIIPYTAFCFGSGVHVQYNVGIRSSILGIVLL